MNEFSRGYDEQGNLVCVMCCLCFECFEPVAALNGGMFITEDGDTVDICVDCKAREFLVFAAMMGA